MSKTTNTVDPNKWPNTSRLLKDLEDQLIRKVNAQVSAQLNGRKRQQASAASRLLTNWIARQEGL